MDTCMQIISRILCPNFPLICVLNTHEKEEEKKGEKISKEGVNGRVIEVSALKIYSEVVLLEAAWPNFPRG